MRMEFKLNDVLRWNLDDEDPKVVLEAHTDSGEGRAFLRELTSCSS